MILETITKPDQIRRLKPSELKILATEVRSRIVEVVSQTGGHLAPSLGTVDLTIALLHLFDPLKDRIVWDVGHQSYGWKILTGRNSELHTLRQFGGLCGFPNRDESPYDAFSTGHSSTSISAALGMACGRDLNKEKGHSIAIIGDGALTGGMSFEALNHAGHLQKNKFIVILNDNAMSISKNVGGLQKYMARMMASRHYNSLKQQVWDLSGSLPEGVRRRFIYGARKLEESMMNILIPNIIFEDLGFKYVGPIDGHNIDQLITIIHRVQRYMVGPVLIHVVTQKGKGYAPAEENASLFHGIGPFEATSGKPVCSGKESYSAVMGNSLTALAKANPKIVAITAAMTAGTGLSPFEKTFPERFFDVGIAEQHAVTLAAGMATKGIKPFVAIYSTFMQRALDQVIHDVALPRLPVVFCLDRAGLVGDDGATHHGAFDLAFLSFIPNMMVLTPSSGNELSAMLAWAATYTAGPIAIRYPRGTALCLPEGSIPENYDPTTAKTMHKGKQIALIGIGEAFSLATEVHHELTEKGYQPTLIQLSCIKPLDAQALNALAKTHSHLFTFEHGSQLGGAGSHISQLLSHANIHIRNFGYPDKFIPHGNNTLLLESIGFTAKDLSAAITADLKS
ncbi:MAG: 1-deoxy-D-xylulose-5-phosphate synthase [Candidatus Cloacimonetes bacterium]|nr:1-deoxy-D-xylulose-5-phosphate synthase [Candidatus Cloacimonadota bacterium]